MSRRAKFAFITWIGPSVGALKKAKVSTDKAFVKQIWMVSINFCWLKKRKKTLAPHTHTHTYAAIWKGNSC